VEVQRVLFDIITGLEKWVHKFIDSIRLPSRYLTLFYGITLGLALILALLAIILHVKPTQAVVDVSATQIRPSTTSTSTYKSPKLHGSNTPTSLPPIPPTPHEKTPSSLGVTATELNGVQVSLWHPWTGLDGEALASILDEFNRTNLWGITVQVVGFEGFGRLDEAVESALLENTQPDVIVDYGYQANHWDVVEALIDMTPYVNDPIWGFSNDEQADFLPAFWEEDIVTDNNSGQTRRLGIPFYRSAYGIFYNQTWAQELGFPQPPITAEDFRVRACAAAQFISEQGDKSNLGKGGWLITPQPGVLVGWINAFGGGIIDPDAPGYLFSTPGTRQAFEYLKDLQNSGCAWSDHALDPQSEFANRHTLFVVGSLFDIPAQQVAFNQAGSNDEWTFIPFPSSTQPVVDTYGPSLLITRSNPAEQLAAWLVTQWLVYPPNQSEWIKVQETFPSRLSTLDYLTEIDADNPQWAQALELLPDAHSEPTLSSWKVMRWALEDVLTQLFTPQFESDQIPLLLQKLDDVADEIYSQVY
jgi:ABC-type glycerol-3-phosphate transport system substrate-binding protein